jgi:hypothetical protein
MEKRKLLMLAMLGALAVATPTFAATAPSGTAKFSGETVAVGVGYTWGNGVLSFKGKDNPFKVDGLTGVGVGVEKMHGTGTVYHLTKVADFAGTYATAGASAAAGKSGAGSSTLKNGKGVVIDFKEKETGFAVTLAAGGMHVAMTPKAVASK